MFELDWNSFLTIGSAAAGIAAMVALAYLVRADWPRPKIVDILIWAIIWAIGGAIVGMADTEVEPSTAILLGALWGILLTLVQITGWSLRKNN